MSIIKKKPVEPIEQPKKKAFRTIRKEITLRAADLSTAARGPSLEMWWASLAPGCAADGAWHDITASREVARHSPQREVFFPNPMMRTRTRRRSCRRRRCLPIGARSGPWRLLLVRPCDVLWSKELLSFTTSSCPGPGSTRRGGSALAAFRPFFSVRVLRLDA